ncbi:ISL3 family transposase [Streptomyces sp. NPDC001691]|uniref:ISL3 family transposase n=1 Tax=Streptomyces sp. NPDC001691 TaxID=3364600 RepID=UPI0036A38582
MGTGPIEDVLFQGTEARVERVTVSKDLVVVEAVACGRPPKCPDCRFRGRRVHSTYERGLAERPLSGLRTMIRLRVRRFFCGRPSCRRRTFVEQVDGLSERYRRSSLGLRGWLYAVAVELGGRPGARLCRKVRMKAGRTQLLGLLLAPPVPRHAPRVLGVDDFALRHCTRYATILVDIETSTVVDVLPDRTTETFAAWLTNHPGAEVICRDRATAYSKAIRQAAPHAKEVADRYHLLQNLSNAVEKTCHQHRNCLRKHAEQQQKHPPPLKDPLPGREFRSTPLVERTRHRHADINRLLEEGWPVNAIARHLQLDRRTVDRYLKTPLDDLLHAARHRRPSKVLEPFKPYIQERFAELGSRQGLGQRIYREIHERGFRGDVRTVQRYLNTLDSGPEGPLHAVIPSPRTLASWVTRPREKLTRDEDQELLDARLACPDIARACDLAWAFLEITRHRRGYLLLEWIRQAEQNAPKPLTGFASYLRQDLDAVTAGLTEPWSSGIVEGHVNRAKTLKRAMYGRATFRLLRTRILLHP